MIIGERVRCVNVFSFGREVDLPSLERCVFVSRDMLCIAEHLQSQPANRAGGKESMIARFAHDAWKLDPAQRSQALEEWKELVKPCNIAGLAHTSKYMTPLTVVQPLQTEPRKIHTTGSSLLRCVRCIRKHGQQRCTRISTSTSVAGGEKGAECRRQLVTLCEWSTTQMVSSSTYCPGHHYEELYASATSTQSRR